MLHDVRIMIEGSKIVAIDPIQLSLQILRHAGLKTRPDAAGWRKVLCAEPGADLCEPA